MLLESGEFLVSLSTKKSFYFSFELLIYILFISRIFKNQEKIIIVNKKVDIYIIKIK